MESKSSCKPQIRNSEPQRSSVPLYSADCLLPARAALKKHRLCPSQVRSRLAVRLLARRPMRAWPSKHYQPTHTLKQPAELPHRQVEKPTNGTSLWSPISGCGASIFNTAMSGIVVGATINLK